MKKNDLNDFTHQKPKNLPQRVSEGAEAAIDAKVKHFVTSAQNMGPAGVDWFENLAQEELEPLAQGGRDPETQRYYPGWQPTDFQKLINRVRMQLYGGGMGESAELITNLFGRRLARGSLKEDYSTEQIEQWKQRILAQLPQHLTQAQQNRDTEGAAKIQAFIQKFTANPADCLRDAEELSYSNRQHEAYFKYLAQAIMVLRSQYRGLENEGVEAVANLFGRSLTRGPLDEKGHKKGCPCGFCRNMGSFGKKAKESEKAKEKDMEEPTEPEEKVEEASQVPPVKRQRRDRSSEAPRHGDEIQYATSYRPGMPLRSRQTPKDFQQDFVHNTKAAQERDAWPGHEVTRRGWKDKSNRSARWSESETPGEVKLSKGLNLGGPAARAYHNMTSKQAMTPEWKPKAYVKAAAEVSGMNKSGQVQGFKNKSAAETTAGKKLPKTRAGESRHPSRTASEIVEALLG